MAGPFQFFDTAAKDRHLYEIYESQMDTMLVGATYSGANGGWNSYLGGVQYIVFGNPDTGVYTIGFQNIFDNANTLMDQSLSTFKNLIVGRKISLTSSSPTLPAAGVVNFAKTDEGIGFVYSEAGTPTALPATASVHVQFLLNRNYRIQNLAGKGYS